MNAELTTQVLKEIEAEFGNPEAQSPYFWNAREVIHIGYIIEREGGQRYGNHPQWGGRLDVFLKPDGTRVGRAKTLIIGGNGIGADWQNVKSDAILDVNRMTEDEEIDKLYWYAVGLHGRTKGWERVNRPNYHLTLNQIQDALERIAQRLDEIAQLDDGTIWSHPLRQVYATSAARSVRSLKKEVLR